MLVRLDDAEVSGIFSIDGYVSAAGRTPEDVAVLIKDRLEANYDRPHRGLDEATLLTGYLAAVVESFSHAPKPIRGTQYRKVPLDQVFVSLFGYPGGNREIGMRRALRTIFGATLEPLAFERRKSVRAFASAVHSAEKLETVLDRHPFVLILGDPGSGKSTLVYQVASRMASASRVGGKGPLPVVVRATDFAVFAEEVRRTRGRLGTLLEFIGRQPLESAPHYPVGRHPKALEPIEADELHTELLRGLTHRGGTVLIDGLDEVGDQERRRTVARLIDSFLHLLTSDEALRSVGIRVLITSRRVGYEQAQLSTKVARYVIEPLDNGAIQKLATNWFVATSEVEAEGRAKAAEFMTRLLDPSSERLRSIAENPYLLTLLSATYVDHNGLPTNRADLYRYVVDNNLFKVLVERNLPVSAEA